MRARVCNVLRRIHPKMRRVLGDGLIGLLVFAVLTIAITAENDSGERAGVWVLSSESASAASVLDKSMAGTGAGATSRTAHALTERSGAYQAQTPVPFSGDRSFALILLAAVFSMLFAFNLMFLRRLRQAYALRRPISQRLRL